MFNALQRFSFVSRNFMKDKREHIIETALELFAEKGFEGASIRDIAEKASVNVAMVNYYFGSKEKLFEKIIEYKAAATRGLLDEILNNASISHIRKIEAVIDAYIEKLFTHRLYHRLVQQELILNQREILQNSIVHNIIPNAQIIKNILESGIEKGDFKKVDIELTIATLNGTINQVLLSKKYCNRLFNNSDDYIPYEDAKFKTRVSTHLKKLMRDHLLNK